MTITRKKTPDASSGPKPRGRKTKAAQMEKVSAAAASTPSPVTAAGPRPDTGLGKLVALMRQPQGATAKAMAEATGWQVHSVRGAIAGALKKKYALNITSEAAEGGRLYRLAPSAQGAEA